LSIEQGGQGWQMTLLFLFLLLSRLPLQLEPSKKKHRRNEYRKQTLVLLA